ncbi:Uncharacterized protein dnm_057120 [Desulfonema magnum]|uniref:Uncharacterized protein n=1 Tax=Desulfonema magnum TaxID=45655 RepID=A0A975GQ93_9BACT|nr:Uncharacterized protein dnm_057120 [Desulfonema magnum]
MVDSELGIALLDNQIFSDLRSSGQIRSAKIVFLQLRKNIFRTPELLQICRPHGALPGSPKSVIIRIFDPIRSDSLPFCENRNPLSGDFTNSEAVDSCFRRNGKKNLIIE